MEFRDVGESEFGAVYEKMREAFPYEERRDFSEQKKCLSDARYRLKNLVCGGECVGFVSYWEYAETVFIEHLAIDKSLRGNGFGTAFLDEFSKRCSKKIILEVEPSEKSEY